MFHFLDQFLAQPFLIPGYLAYLVVFGATLLEAFPFIGFIIPGQTLLILAGLTAKLNELNLALIIFLATLGAIGGDSFGYFLGKKYGYALLAKYKHLFKIKQKHLEKTEELINKNAGLTLILGRFNSVTRALAPFVAGVTNLPLKKFIRYNIIGAILWATVFGFIGFLFGHSYKLISSFIGKGSALIIILLLLGFVIYKLAYSKKEFLSKAHLIKIGVNLSLVWVFYQILEESGNEWLSRLDIQVLNWATSIATPFLTSSMKIITSLADTLIFFCLCLAVSGVLIFYKRFKDLFWFCGTLGIGYLILQGIKAIVERPRPIDSIITVNGWSFPSGHATMSTIFFLSVVYLFLLKLKKGYLKNLLITLGIILPLLIGFSRLYLKVHNLSDVLGGFTLGLFIISLNQLFQHWFKKKEIIN
jgi:undecaprenyl-diphosphatase